MIRSGKVIAVIASVIPILILITASDQYLAEEGDLVFEEGPLPARFPHSMHRIRFRCSVCHDRIFEMKLGSAEMTMALFKSGKYCGECHNGKVGFNIGFETCNRCHSGIP